jgi:RNA polymerase sigma-70 factor (ECF subfamily)
MAVGDPDRAETSQRRPGTPEPEHAGFDDFYRLEFPRLLVLARALTGAAYAEDVAQESLLVAYRRWHTIATMRSPAGYVRGICIHKSVSVVRRRTLERQLLGRLTPRAALPPSQLPEDGEAFWSHVRALPRRQAQVVALHYALDMSVADVAEVLDCAEGTVKAHLHRARTSLAATLQLEEDQR